MTAFELAVQDAAGLVVAKEQGVDRLELCSALALGGVTPSAGFIEVAVATGVPVHVLVRPRGGGFEYSDDERRLILFDALHALDLGAAGVVVGSLRHGSVDRDLVREVVAEAAGTPVSFHRAFDLVDDVGDALEALIDEGVTRILTSGGASSAPDAIAALQALVQQARGRIEIMAGAGVTSANVLSVAASGVDAVHASAKRLVIDTVGISLGTLAAEGAGTRETVDAVEVRDIVALLRQTEGDQ